MSVADKLTTIAENQEKVYDAGKKAEQQKIYDDFWDELQEFGNRTMYRHAFGGWTDNLFKPKYDMHPTEAAYMFTNSYITDIRPETIGVNVDFSKIANFNYVLITTETKYIGVVDCSKSVAGSYICQGSTNLISIEKIILHNNQTYGYGTTGFQNCNNLVHIRFEGGTIPTSSSFQYSPLDLESAKNVISVLRDYSQHATNNGRYTITFSETTKNYLTADNPLWEDEVMNKGWLVG